MIEERAKIINAKDPNATNETTRVMIIGKDSLWKADIIEYASLVTI